MQRLNNKIALVTGASRGIGRAVAVELAREGADVIVNYLTHKDEAEAVAAEIQELGRRALVWQADVADEAAVGQLYRAALQQFARLDILVANAGMTSVQLAAAMTLDQWETTIRVNLTGAFLCIRAAIPHMMRQRSGSIVTFSSVAIDHPSRGNANYVAAKGGVEALTRALASELAPKRIRVNAVAPGVIVTDMTKRIRTFADEEVLGHIPLRRHGEPREVARAVCFLASEDASYITGETLHVTGGYGL